MIPGGLRIRLQTSIEVEMGVHGRDTGAEHDREPTGVSRRILVVEDDEDTAAVLTEFLQLQGHRAQAVHDGAEALRVAREDPLDVVLLDLGLPKMNGYEVAKRLRREHGDTLVLIALTGYQEDVERLREAGFDQHLLKPFDVHVLSRQLAGLESRPSRPEAR